jgi:hypothetical protein
LVVSRFNRLIQHGQLNLPWGVALAPASFGALVNQLLIGNFGNGHINAYNPTTGEFVGKVRDPHGQAIVVDGLWSLRVGSNTAGSANFGPDKVFFTAGPNGEEDGLFGTIASSPQGRSRPVGCGPGGQAAQANRRPSLGTLGALPWSEMTAQRPHWLAGRAWRVLHIGETDCVAGLPDQTKGPRKVEEGKRCPRYVWR